MPGECRETLTDEGETAAGFVSRAAECFAACGIERIEAVMTDNHWGYTKNSAFTATLVALGARHVTIRPHCPWQNGTVERFNRTRRIEWAYRQVSTSNQQRARALPSWLDYYNHRGADTARSEADHPSSVTNLLMTGYT
jgi:transposase InsO family protein